MLISFFFICWMSVLVVPVQIWKSDFKWKIESNEYLNISNWRKMINWSKLVIEINITWKDNVLIAKKHITPYDKCLKITFNSYLIFFFLLFCCFMLIFLFSKNGRIIWKKHHFKNLFGRDYLKLNTLRYPHQRIVKIDDLRGGWDDTKAKLPGKYIKI